MRRYVIDLAAGVAREEIITDGQFEFPMVNWTLSSRRHKYGYVASGKPGDFFHTGIDRIDTESGQRTGYDFGPGHYVGEPVFAPKPGATQSADASSDPAWILAEVHHEVSRTTRLAILDAENLPAGPVAQVLLDHHLPISFHGWWHEA